MAVPKRKHSNSRTGTRRSQDHKTARQVAYCANCHEAILPHAVCPNCGTYMGRKVVEMEEK
ncbi:MAG: 50S ribosomal protein L32 [Planctomycetia bacterium]|nr:50S ribosomal protein L32 [Planctomycetia bacterium]